MSNPTPPKLPPPHIQTILGVVTLAIIIPCLIYVDLGIVPTLLAFVLVLAGLGMLGQGLYRMLKNK